jgi:hypothetical protein
MFNSLILGLIFYYFYKNQIKTGKVKAVFKGLLPKVINSLQLLLDSIEGKNYANKTRGFFMSKEEARQLLGVNNNASKEEILQSFKKLMLKVHPDHGGTSYLANKIIQAKKVLLNE